MRELRDLSAHTCLITYLDNSLKPSCACHHDCRPFVCMTPRPPSCRSSAASWISSTGLRRCSKFLSCERRACHRWGQFPGHSSASAVCTFVCLLPFPACLRSTCARRQRCLRSCTPPSEFKEPQPQPPTTRSSRTQTTLLSCLHFRQRTAV